MKLWAEAWREECEAREWIRRFEEHKKKRGLPAANEWWIKTITDIEKKRGAESAQSLKNTMNRIKNEVRRKD
jgi:hypothetical protein